MEKEGRDLYLPLGHFPVAHNSRGCVNQAMRQESSLGPTEGQQPSPAAAPDEPQQKAGLNEELNPTPGHTAGSHTVS